MKQVLFLGIAASALLLSNCSNEDLEGGKISAQGNKHVITASFEGCKDGPSTRTTVGTDNQILWTEGDAFNLFYTDESGSTRYGITSGVGTPSASFEGTVESGKTPLYAVFPSQEEMTISSNKLTMTLPSTITWSANSNGPMLAKVKEGSVDKGVYFNHLAALLKVVVSKMPEGAAIFKITSSENIAGTCTATVNADEPVLGAPAGDDAKKQIIVSFPAITQEKANSEQVFFVPLPPILYQRLTITLTNEDGSVTYFQKTRNKFTLKRADLLEAVIDKTSIDATTPSGVNTQLNDAKLEETIQNATNGNVPVNIALTEQITTSSTSEPLKLPMVDNAQLNMTFEKAPVTTTDAPLVIEAKDNSTATGTNALTVAIPAVAADNAPSFTVDLPKTTVTLASKDDASTTYNKVIATTADNTLVVEKGVTVKELIIKGGNVKIYGTVEKLSRHSENATESTTVEVYDAGDIKDVTDNQNKIAINAYWDGKTTATPISDATAGSLKVYTAAQFASFQSKKVPVDTKGKDLPATIEKNTTLYCNVNLQNNPWIGMVLNKDVTFDGGNHTVSNIKITEHVLNEQSIYTPEACVGLFAATKPGSVIKNITVDGFTVEGKGADAKWSGALVGYSYGTKEYTNCHAKNVNIQSDGFNAYRIGGLIGFIASVTTTDGGDVAVTVTNSSAENITIKGGFSLGGLVGTIQGSALRTFNQCKVEGIKLSINANSCALTGAFSNKTFYGPKDYVGNMSKFIGDIASSVTITSCTCNESFTAEELQAFGYNDFLDYTYKKGETAEATETNRTTALANAKHYSLTDATSPLIPAVVGTGKTIKIDNTTLTDGTNYNRFTEIEQ